MAQDIPATVQQEGGPHAAPQTDPTNPFHQEAVGEWTRAEEENERRHGEPGLTLRDHEERNQTR
jgi:hypothetical protein